MNFSRNSCLSLLLLFICLLLSIPVCNAQPGTAASFQSPPQPIPYSDNTYPEIVRLAYVEGDVRVARAEKRDSGWEMAATGLPLYSGFSLVTGADGRAEIELEDASTVYLDSNSVLVLNDMHTTSGVPYTYMSLPSGTVMLHVHSDIPREIFLLETPTDHLSSLYPQLTDFRVTSYTNAMALTPLRESVMRLLNGKRDLLKGGATYYFDHGVPVLPGNADSMAEDKTPPAVVKTSASISAPTGTGAPANPNGESADSFASFDQWVAGRESARQAAMTQAMQASGLKKPLLGLDELAGQGKFFPCAPYGTCWELPAPPPNPAPQPANSDTQTSAPTLNEAGGATPTPVSQKSAKQSTNSGIAPQPFYGTADFFPCLPDAMLYRFGMYPYWNGPMQLTALGNQTYAYPWWWTVCHAGTWIYREHRYLWVPRHRRWHRPPIRWVHYGKKEGFVPLHPRDLPNKLPINRAHGVYTLSGKLNGKELPLLVRAALAPGDEVHLMKQTPKDYRNVFFAPLHPAAEPHIEAQRVDFPMHSAPRAVPAEGVKLSFDRKSKGFIMARQVSISGHMRTVTAPVSRGSVRTGGGFNGGGRGSGGAFNGGARTGGGFSGGAPRGGGFSGGGGGHAGGGGGGGGHAGGGGGGGGHAGGGGGGGSHH